MPPKSARARRAPNREPTSLAIPTPPLIETAIPIDPWLLSLANAGNTLDASNTPANSESDLLANDEAFIDEESQQDVQLEPELDTQPEPETQLIGANTSQSTKVPFAWTFIMEQMLFNELLEQANNGKRADNGFKKEAWTAACIAV
jgi:hypothetical protein